MIGNLCAQYREYVNPVNAEERMWNGTDGLYIAPDEYPVSDEEPVTGDESSGMDGEESSTEEDDPEMDDEEDNDDDDDEEDDDEEDDDSEIENYPFMEQIPVNGDNYPVTAEKKSRESEANIYARDVLCCVSEGTEEDGKYAFTFQINSNTECELWGYTENNLQVEETDPEYNGSLRRYVVIPTDDALSGNMGIGFIILAVMRERMSM